MNKIYKSFSILTIGSIITRAMSFLFKIYLSRELGAEIIGVYQIAFSIFLLFSTLSTSGIPVTSSRLIAETDDNKKINSIFSSALIISNFFMLIVLSIFLFIPSLIKLFINDVRVLKIIYILLPMFFTSALYSSLRSFLWGKKEFNLFTVSELLDELFKIIITVLLFTFFKDLYIDSLYIYAVSLVAGDIILILILFFIVFKKGAKITKPLHIKKLIKCSLPITTSRLLASLLSFFISVTIPLLLVSKFNLSKGEATSELGRASGMVMSLIFAPNAILSSMSIVLIPEIAKYKALNNFYELSRKLNYAILITTIISCIFFIFFFGIGPQIGLILYKDILVGKYLSFASIMMLPIGLNGIISSYLNTLNKERIVFYNYCICSIFLVLIILLSTKYIGIYSYFVALIVFHLSNMTLNLIFINKEVKISINTSIATIVIFVYSLIVGYILKFISTLFNINLFLNAVLSIIIGTLLIIIPLIPFYAYFFRKNPKFTLL